MQPRVYGRGDRAVNAQRRCCYTPLQSVALFAGIRVPRQASRLGRLRDLAIHRFIRALTGLVVNRLARRDKSAYPLPPRFGLAFAPPQTAPLRHLYVSL
jgi:hypothetical protein